MYPEAKIVDAMKIWKLPDGKQDMLAEICQNGEYFLEEKIDGYWYEYEKTDNYAYLFSRNKSVTTGTLSEKGDNVPHIMEALSCLPANTIIIGEIYYPGGTSKTVTKVMGCLSEEAIKRQKGNPIHYYLHDIIEYDGVNLIDTGAEDRYKILEAVWRKHNLARYNFLRLAAKVDTDLEAEISRILKMGGEGVVLKKRDYPYTPGKRPAWSTIKVKQMDSIDLICIGFVPATKEYTGKELETWPYWERPYNIMEVNSVYMVPGDFFDENSPGIIGKYKSIPIKINGDFILTDECQYGQEGWRPVTKYYYFGWNTAIKIGAYDDSGNLVELGTVSSGLTDEIKADMTKNPEKYLGQVCSLDCMSINKKDHTLRHPVFKGWRDDKDAKDCIISEVFG